MTTETTTEMTPTLTAIHANVARWSRVHPSCPNRIAAAALLTLPLSVLAMATTEGDFAAAGVGYFDAPVPTVAEAIGALVEEADLFAFRLARAACLRAAEAGDVDAQAWVTAGESGRWMALQFLPARTRTRRARKGSGAQSQQAA